MGDTHCSGIKDRDPKTINIADFVDATRLTKIQDRLFLRSPKRRRHTPTRANLKHKEKHRFLNLDMSKTSGVDVFPGKRTPAAMTTAGTKLKYIKHAYKYIKNT